MTPKLRRMELSQKSYFVTLLTTRLASLAEAQKQAPTALADHITRTKRLHAEGKVLMAGAFVESADAPISTMAVLSSREAAEEFIAGDPFVQIGLVESSEIREWANMLRPSTAA